MKRAFLVIVLCLFTLSGCKTTEDYSLNMKTDLELGEFNLLGIDFNLPTPVQSFINIGFQPNETYDNVDGLSGVENDYKILKNGDGVQIKVAVANYEKSSNEFENCYVTAVVFEPSQLKKITNFQSPLILNDGITHDIPLEFLLELMGEPDSTWTEGSVSYSTYYGTLSAPTELLEFAIDYKNEVSFGYKNSTLREIEIKIDVFE